MTALGYCLTSELHGPRELVDHAARAEQAGFTYALISDHYHPWTNEQGHSPFVWSVIGGIAKVTSTLRLGTGVTCPTMRVHPGIVAQAAATSQILLEGRFFLGVGTGENLNEHIFGDHWPAASVRREMLEEAVALMRELWKGGYVEHRGKHYTVENARVFDVPDEKIDVFVAASGPKAAKLAKEIGDGLIGVAPDAELTEIFGKSKPRVGQVHACWAETEEEGIETARKLWPNMAAKGELSQELRLPAHFEAATEDAPADEFRANISCGPDPERHLENIQKFVDAGYDHVYVHQIGPDQEGFFRFYEKEILPRFRG